MWRPAAGRRGRDLNDQYQLRCCAGIIPDLRPGSAPADEAAARHRRTRRTWIPPATRPSARRAGWSRHAGNHFPVHLQQFGAERVAHASQRLPAGHEQRAGTVQEAQQTGQAALDVAGRRGAFDARRDHHRHGGIGVHQAAGDRRRFFRAAAHDPEHLRPGRRELGHRSRMVRPDQRQNWRKQGGRRHKLASGQRSGQPSAAAPQNLPGQRLPGGHDCGQVVIGFGVPQADPCRRRVARPARQDPYAFTPKGSGRDPVPRRATRQEPARTDARHASPGPGTGRQERSRNARSQAGRQQSPPRRGRATGCRAS